MMGLDESFQNLGKCGVVGWFHREAGIMEEYMNYGFMM
jgi:hypothetical protein